MLNTTIKPAPTTDLVSLSLLVKQYHTELRLLEDYLERVGLVPQEVDGERYLTEGQAEFVHRYYQRLQLGWLVSINQRQDNPWKGI